MLNYDWLVIIDCGHGIETPGKRSPAATFNLENDPLYFREYQFSREQGAMVADLLYFQGVKVVLLQKDDHDMPLEERTALANKLAREHGIDKTILISIHANAAGRGREWMSARGWCVYTSPGKTGSDLVATEMFYAAEEEFLDPGREYIHTFHLDGRQKPIRSDWTDQDPDYEAAFWMLRKTVCKAVLVENFFQDNKEDVAYLKSLKGKGSCAFVMSEGIIRYIEKYGKS